MRIAAGFDRASTGQVAVLGVPAGDKELLSRVGYLDQTRPLYDSLTVGEHLELGRSFNASWNQQLAESYLAQLGISNDAKVGQLSVGQQAQVALVLAMSKEPELLLLDEPAAALDPLARQSLLQLLLSMNVDFGSTVILSTHDLADVDSICDYVVIMAEASVALADYSDFILESHRIISCVEKSIKWPRGVKVIKDLSSVRETVALVQLTEPLDDCRWMVVEPSLQEIVLAYLGSNGKFEVEGNV